MSSKLISKNKKDSSKHLTTYLNRINDDEIKAELEAMTGRAYNLHGINQSDDSELFKMPLTRIKKSSDNKKRKSTRSLLSTALLPLSSSSSSSSSSSTSSTTTLNSLSQTPQQSTTSQESHIPFSSSNASVKDLQKIIRRAGISSEDKYKILDARDKLMRYKKVKTHTLDSKVTRGTCPDMCPEKERLMREFQRQVSQYEFIDNASSGEHKICHKKAVKQYSRSSADQEEPMPQDLRPVRSLKMTMSYLLHEITDLCELDGTNLADWYHFLWDRTRGIRKDITQQELCDLDTVELLEQCARFHILCSERLCAEEASVFDKKINTENLTKCLQTLKYMYHDLRINGTDCKNESEFRAYIILLNLNNANFMWDLQRLPSNIQKSKEVKFSIKVYSSIQSNNYAKFFKLVKETTYLNACILLRYFFQVRVAALSVMLKAYSQKNSKKYPLYEFIDILGFEGPDEAIYFCKKSSLTITDDEFDINLDRESASLPPPLIEQGRAKELVEKKRLNMGWSIGQTIAGGKMPERNYFNHKPHNSFDDLGYLKRESINASDQNGSILGEELIDEEEEEEEEDEDEDEEIEEEEEEEDDGVEEEEEEEATEIMGEEEEEEELMGDEQDDGEIFEEDVEEEEEQEEEEEEEENNYGYDDDDEDMDVPPSPINTRPPLFTKKNKQSVSSTTSIFSSSASSFSFANPSANNSSNFEQSQQPFATKQSDVFSFSNANTKQNIFSKPSEPQGFLPPPAAATANNTSIFSNSSQFVSSNQSNQNIFSSTSTSAAPFSQKSSIFSDFSVPSTAKPSPVIPVPVETKITSPKIKIENKIPDNSTNKIQEDENNKLIEKIEIDSSKIANEMETDVVHEICSTVLNKELEKIKLRDNTSNKILNDVIDEYILDNCKIILDKEIELQTNLHNVEKKIKNRVMMKYFKLWCQFVMKKKSQRKALDNTPVWLPKKSLQEYASSLYRKDQDLVIQSMRRKSLKTQNNNDIQMKYLEPIETKIYTGLKENLKTLDIELSPLIFWKMLISWPQMDNRALLMRHKKIMSQYFCPSNYSISPIIKSYKPNPHETLNICIKQGEGLIDDNHLTGVDALFFIATTDEDPKLIVKRLTRIVVSRKKLMPVPLVLIIFGQTSIKDTEIKNQLDYLFQSGYILEYTVHHQPTIDEDTVLKLTQTSLLWLTLNKSPPVPLEMDNLKEIITTCLTDELWLRISGHGSFNLYLENALEDAKFVIDLHNEAVEHLLDIIMDPESLLYTDFPPEFKMFLAKDYELPCSYEYFDDEWKQEENRIKIEDIISNFTLPQWPFKWPIDDTMELQKAIIKYCQISLTEANYNTIACNILSNIFFMSDGEAQPKFIHIILEILKAKINLIDTEYRIVYNKNHIKHFRTLPWWFKSRTLDNFKIQYDENIENKPVVKKRRINLEEENKNISLIIDEYDSIWQSMDESIDDFKSKYIKNNQQNIQIATEKLDKKMAQQQLANRKFQEKLECALRDT
ncbi:hypothetical protein HCN44_008339 [Aphidius gifuensis]|uniref:SAC3/GANP/THP3 conserved domain-containing protein n=1 Tax=Aphidius gifuensis TaxID=684658 RepID=A0A834XQF7_APHGI|nr:uncharacterized protein LOC122858046 [Aphidius gifuensis]KAF7989665.1 hypothetical protein HCN44_008339 [Aphidius gifuensis]